MIFARFLLATTMAPVLILLFALYVPSTEAQMVQACGKNLRDLLALVCESKYYGPNHKRYLNNLYDFPESSEEDHAKSPNYLNELFMGRTPDVYESETPHYRIAKGVVNDCCQRPCSMRTLELYCL